MISALVSFGKLDVVAHGQRDDGEEGFRVDAHVQHAADLDAGDTDVRARIKSVDVIEVRVQLVSGRGGPAGMRHREREEPGRRPATPPRRSEPRRCHDQPWALLASRRPGFVVAGGVVALATLIVVARRPVTGGRAGRVGDVRLAPWPAGRRLDWLVGRVMQPGVPFRRHGGGLDGTLVDDPPARPSVRAGSPVPDSSCCPPRRCRRGGL